ncbi:hypothetical protein AAC387_Pa08g1486 [Persea americana]
METKNPYLQKQSIIKDSSSTSSRVFSLLQPAAETGTSPAPLSLSLSSPPSPTRPADIRPPNLAQASPPASQNSALPALPPAHKSACLALLPSNPTSLHYQESRPSPLPILHNRSPRLLVEGETRDSTRGARCNKVSVNCARSGISYLCLDVVLMLAKRW